jgi:LuxR family transcriptional regulator, maltose regulon positive regulatory protein
MTCLLSTLSKTWPGVADDALVLLERDPANGYDAVVAAANELAAVERRGVIVVDDLHLAAPDPGLLTAFIGALPDRFRFVIGTRSDPPLSLARWRLGGDLLELRSDDLRFGEAEVADFFGRHEMSLTAAELLRLHELTEGWPAGVQLAAIALQSGARRDDFLGAFARTDHSVGDFLLTEVLSNLPASLVDFLVATSVFDAFDAELCAAVTGVEDSAVVLERLIAENLFVVPLDDRVRWFRYHHLFGTFLRARLAFLGTTRVRAAHDRAGRALEARGDTAGALQHAMAVDDAERAVQVLRAAIARSRNVSEGAGVAVQAIRLWLHQYGAESVRTDPMGVLDLVIGLITLGGQEDAPPWLERVGNAHPDADGPLLALIEGAWGGIPPTTW